MHPEDEAKLNARVVRAAEAALADHQYVSVIDLFTGMGLLAPSHVANWRRGIIATLDEVLQGGPKKLQRSLEIFYAWAEVHGLKPSEASYSRRAPGGVVELRFSTAGDSEIEKVFRTHFVSATLPEHKKQKLEARVNKPAERPVFLNIRDSQCSECGADLPSGSFLFMEGQEPLCLDCAGLGDLEYLPAGDAALTRRATKYSSKKAVVVKFSRTRGRYERQGILVEEAGLHKAEEECTSDSEERAQARVRGAVQREKQDRELIERMTQEIQHLFPRISADEAHRIASHTARRGSGRVGRSAAGRALDEEALRLAVSAAVRHNHTDYDGLLAAGMERATARAHVRDKVERVLEKWRNS